MTYLFHALIWFSVAYMFYFIFFGTHRRTALHPNPRRTSAMAVRRASGNTITDISGEIRGETQMAYRFYDGTKFVWLPKSQVEWDEESRTMAMPIWLASEKELI